MGETSVADIDLGRFHQTLADIRVPGRQATHQHQIDQQIEITRHALARDPEPCRKLGRVQEPALFMGQHGPEPPQRLRWNAQPERRDIAFEIGADEILPPGEAGAVRCGQ